MLYQWVQFMAAFSTSTSYLIGLSCWLGSLSRLLLPGRITCWWERRLMPKSFHLLDPSARPKAHPLPGQADGISTLQDGGRGVPGMGHSLDGGSLLLPRFQVWT